MIIDRSFVAVKNIVKWPFQNEDNFSSSTIATIAFLASQRFLNVSYIFSLIFGATTFISIRMYQNFQISNKQAELERQKRREEKEEAKRAENEAQILAGANIIAGAFKDYESLKTEERKQNLLIRKEKMNEIMFFIKKDLLCMKDIIRGYQLKDGKRINEKELSAQRAKIEELCTYFGLNSKAFFDTWITWPAVCRGEYAKDCSSRFQYFLMNSNKLTRDDFKLIEDELSCEVQDKGFDTRKEIKSKLEFFLKLDKKNIEKIYSYLEDPSKEDDYTYDIKVRKKQLVDLCDFFNIKMEDFIGLWRRYPGDDTQYYNERLAAFNKLKKSE